ncbi:hypothetical protein [Granulicella sp. dw_53]|uniref:hypothetical protein n=1 Tax=Granulicella sp. dw_53 TaxID=2719792 RepID=UPI001BD36813|nr:hypothetical protein [Granulicella sp. dw_53]
MRAIPQKCLSLVGLILTSAPVLMAQSLPFGLQNQPAVSKDAVSTDSDLSNFTGQYSFAVQGALVGKDIISRKVGIVGSLVSDGKGHIISGVEDYNSEIGTFPALPITGTYTLNAAGVGTLTLKSSQMTQTFSFFAPQVPGRVQNATLTESDGLAGVTGSIDKQIAATSLDGGYNFSLTGQTVETSGLPNPVALGGNFVATTGNVLGSTTFFVGEAQMGGAVVLPATPFQATITAPDSNGRLAFTVIFAPNGQPAHFVGYALDPTHINFLTLDRASEFLPLLTGQAVR